MQQSVQLPDETIVALYWQRNEAAIVETDKKYGKLLFRIAYRILANRQDGEECKNDTYLKVWNEIPPARPRFFRAFLAAIVRSLAIDRLRFERRKKRAPHEAEACYRDWDSLFTDSAASPPPPKPIDAAIADRSNPEEEFFNKELGEHISRFLRLVNERQRYIFLNRWFLMESVETIARELSLSPATVYRELEALKQGLKDYLEKEGVML